MSNRDFAATLKGMGPNISLSEIEISARQQALRSEYERFEWIRNELSNQRLLPMSSYLNALRDTAPRVPGSIEASLVALSIHDDPLAKVVLAAYRPPEDLELLYLICRETRHAREEG